MKFTPCQSMRSHQAMADSPSLQLSELKGLKMIRKIVPAAVLAATMAAAFPATILGPAAIANLSLKR